MHKVEGDRKLPAQIKVDLGQDRQSDIEKSKTAQGVFQFEGL
ncbi:hypothetical protein EYZ11_010165 [Aspergillus tanneri]|uniref:Uncharacterized protein n=1 Tax=Aspergillus tanneri TaxID=1220188 RepID=A0A4V3UNA5_9EURO|nr:hypothetical protein EYZ11_010165 [Aspergillus tanneri]